MATAAGLDQGRGALAMPADWRRRRSEARPASSFAAVNHFTPVLWLLGLVNLVNAVLVLRGLVRHRSTDPSVVGIALLWWLVGSLQVLSVTINWLRASEPLGDLLHKLLSTPTTGWFVLGAIFLIGPMVRDDGRLTRSFCVLGLYMLTIGVFSLGLARIGGGEALWFTSPPGHLVPDHMTPLKAWFRVSPYGHELLGDSLLPRLQLFYSWSTMLGFAGIGVVFIGLGEPRRSLRMLALAGGLFALVTSASRAAMLAFLVAAMGYAWLRSRDPALRSMVLACAGLVATLTTAFGYTPDVILAQLYDALTSLRSGSSAARHWVYQASLEAFWERPILGYGWIGPDVHPNVPIPLGSHSSLYGTLYLGGAATVVSMLVAMLTTLTYLGLRALRGGRAHQAAFMIALCLVIMAYGEGITSFILPCAPILCWVAGTLEDEDGPRARCQAP